MALWGLVMAKARSTFTLTDLVDSNEIKKKYSKIFYIVIMVGVAQLFKISAESKYMDTFVDNIESKIDKTTGLNGPIVGASHSPKQIAFIDFHKFGQIFGFFFTSSLSIASVILSKGYHVQHKKLEKLKSICNDPNYKVLIGSEPKGKMVLDMIKKHKQGGGDIDNESKFRQQKVSNNFSEPTYQPPCFLDQTLIQKRDEEQSVELNQLEYSLYEDHKD